MALTALWVGGSVARPASVGPGHLELITGSGGGTIPCSDINGLPDGSGITFRGVGNTANAFSFPIPTPVILNDKRAKVYKVFVLYKADPYVEFADFSVFDGTNKIVGPESVQLTG